MDPDSDLDPQHCFKMKNNFHFKKYVVIKWRAVFVIVISSFSVKFLPAINQQRNEYSVTGTYKKVKGASPRCSVS